MIDSNRSNRDVFITIPAYNESTVIRQTVEPLIREGYSVAVVDDGSHDGTSEQLGDLPVHVVRHPTNLGQGAALQTGMTFALRRSARFIVHFDADGQHQSDDIPNLLDPLRRGIADVTLGSRFLRDEDRRNIPKLRTLALKGGIIVNWLATSVWISDTANGFRAFTGQAACTIRLNEDGFAYNSDLLRQIKQNGMRCVEVPTNVVYSAYSLQKGMSVLNGLNMAFDMVVGRVFR